MLQKLLLAVTMTFALNLFLEVRLPVDTQTTTRDYLAEMPTTSNRLSAEFFKDNP